MTILRRFISHTVTKNATALYGVQFAGYLLPLITIPYLARVLRPEEFGYVAFTQSFALWSSLLVEYGFNLSATRDIVSCRKEKGELAQIVARVHGAKLILITSLLFIAVSLVWLLPIFRQKPDYFIWAFFNIVALGFSPFWYFQGTENMVRPVLMEFSFRTVSIAAVFPFVRIPEDGWKVIALQTLSGLLNTGITIYWVYREVPWRWFNFNSSFLALRQGWNMFLFRTASSLYMTSGILILGFLNSPAIVGYYAGADKIYRAAVSLLLPLSQAIYPRINLLIHYDQRQALRWMSFTLMWTAGVAIALGLTVASMSPLLVKLLFGAGYEATVPALRVLAGIIPITSVNTVLGMQWMLPHGMEKASSKIILSAGALNIFLTIFLVPKLLHLGVAWALMISEIAVFIGFYTVLRIKKIFPLNCIDSE